MKRVTDINKLSELVNITERGGIVLGGQVVCDGFYEDAILHIITHAHSDHIRGLRNSIMYAHYIAATPATMEILEALGYRIPRHKRLPLDYGKPIRIEDTQVTLYPSRHIIGSAQVEVKVKNYTLAYTGDFKLPGTSILHPDVLVIEATYGHPKTVRPFKDEVETLFTDLVMEGLSKGPVAVFGYHGKLQEAMEILRSADLDVPFIAPERVYKIAMIAEKYGMKLSPIYRDGSRDAREALRNNWYVYFHHISGWRRRSVDGYNIILSGWEFEEPIRRLDNNVYLVALSDHADFDDLLTYVKESKPKLVVIDGYRSSWPQTLAREIKQRLNVEAIVMP